MDRISIKNIIIKSLTSLDSVDDQAQTEIASMDEAFHLFGSDARLDSLDLISVILDLEEALSAELDRFLSLTDDAALSREISPFDTIGTLLDYCAELIRARNT
jgi:acyl carrier protein